MATSKLFGDNLTKCWEVTCNGLVSQPGGVGILLHSTTLHTTQTGDKPRPDWPSGLPYSNWGQTLPLPLEIGNACVKNTLSLPIITGKNPRKENSIMSKACTPLTDSQALKESCGLPEAL